MRDKDATLAGDRPLRVRLEKIASLLGLVKAGAPAAPSPPSNRPPNPPDVPPRPPYRESEAA